MHMLVERVHQVNRCLSGGDGMEVAWDSLGHCAIEKLNLVSGVT